MWLLVKSPAYSTAAALLQAISSRWNLQQTCNYAASAAPLTKAPGMQSSGKKRFRLPPESEDAEFLTTHVAGLNYTIDSKPVKLKSDSEYPDWIWQMRLGRPPTHEELEPGSRKFWETVAYENLLRWRRLQRTANKPKMLLGKTVLKRKEWMERIKYRAILAQEFDAGHSEDELKEKFDMQITLRPQVPKEVAYADEIDQPKVWKY